MLDIDRERQRISLGLKQTQEDPWQRVVSTYQVGDELVGKVTKVVTFGAFVEILDGVEGLVHISELAAHHVESPRELVAPDDEIRVKILEIDSDRRRLSLSIKRVEDQVLPVPGSSAGGPLPADYDDAPELGLSEDVFPGDDAAQADAAGEEPTEDGEVDPDGPGLRAGGGRDRARAGGGRGARGRRASRSPRSPRPRLAEPEPPPTSPRPARPSPRPPPRPAADEPEAEADAPEPEADAPAAESDTETPAS